MKKLANDRILDETKLERLIVEFLINNNMAQGEALTKLQNYLKELTTNDSGPTT